MAAPIDAQPNRTNTKRAAILSSLGGGMILFILLLDPVFVTINGQPVMGCLFTEVSPTWHFLGPTTAFVIAWTYRDFHLFGALLAALAVSVLAGVWQRGRFFWLNALACGVGLIVGIIIAGWVINASPCRPYTPLGFFEQDIAVLGTLLGTGALLIGNALHFLQPARLPTYQETRAQRHRSTG